jgi:hypothetical protein
MQELKLQNKEYILKFIKDYAIKNNLDFLSLMETFYKVIISELKESNDLNVVVFDLKDKLKKDSIWETEEELFHVISWELDRQYTSLVFQNANADDIKEVFKFLTENYLEIFKPYYEKKKFISQDDYDECVVSVYNNFSLEKEVADVLVGKWIEDNIIK